MSDPSGSSAPDAAADRAPVNPVLARSVRNGFCEAEHRGVAVALRADGTVASAFGAVDAPVLPRSVNKPLQAAGLLRLGLASLAGLDTEMVAISAASHSGEAHHLEAVRRLLDAAGLTADDLRNVEGMPLAGAERRSYVREGRGPSRLAMSCSGKHAAMLATAVVRGEDPAGYLEPDSPLQRDLRDAVSELAGEPVAATTVDGCGAPMFALSPRALAAAFSRVATADGSSPEGRVAAAMRSRPDLIAGTRRDATELMRLVPGLVAKDGAAGVYAVATAEGAATVVKLDAGASEPCVPVIVGLLHILGVEEPGLDRYAAAPVLGGGAQVGELRCSLPAPAASGSAAPS